MHHVGVVDPLEQLTLAPEPGQRHVVPGQGRPQHLDHDLASRPDVTALMDRAEAALADHLVERIPAADDPGSGDHHGPGNTERDADGGRGRRRCWARLGARAGRVASERFHPACLRVGRDGEGTERHVTSRPLGLATGGEPRQLLADRLGQAVHLLVGFRHVADDGVPRAHVPRDLQDPVTGEMVEQASTNSGKSAAAGRNSLLLPRGAARQRRIRLHFAAPSRRRSSCQAASDPRQWPRGTARRSRFAGRSPAGCLPTARRTPPAPCPWHRSAATDALLSTRRSRLSPGSAAVVSRAP